LIANRRIALMLMNDYHMTHYTWMMPQWILCTLSLCGRVMILIYATSSLCVMYNVNCLQFVMCRTIMCYVLLQITMLCMWKTMCLKSINGCVEPIICGTSCICFGAQILVLLNGWVFYLVVIVVVVISNMSYQHMKATTS
jgi:hypothetical protein